MSALTRLLDAAKAKTEAGNDSAVADALKVTRSSVSVWRSGGVITEKHLTALVALAEADASAAVDVLREQAKTDAQRAVWGDLRGRLLHIMSTAARLITGRSRAADEPRAPQ